MSKKINVNPNFYKTGGREHAEGHGEVVVHDQEKRELSGGKGKGTKVIAGGMRGTSKKK
jgi:hypothetical protein